MQNTEELSVHLSKILEQLRQAVDASAEIKKRSKDDAKAVAGTWENFLGSFIGYVKETGRKTGQNLLKDISFFNIWK